MVDKAKLKMTVSGQAKDYASVALQSDVLQNLLIQCLNIEFFKSNT